MHTHLSSPSSHWIVGFSLVFFVSWWFNLTCAGVSFFACYVCCEKLDAMVWACAAKGRQWLGEEMYVVWCWGCVLWLWICCWVWFSLWAPARFFAGGRGGANQGTIAPTFICYVWITIPMYTDVGRFLKFFHCRNQKEIADNKKEKFPTAP